MATSKYVKVVRTLTYYGPQEWVDRTLQQSYIKGTAWLSNDKVIVSEQSDFEEVATLPEKRWDSGASENKQEDQF